MIDDNRKNEEPEVKDEIVKSRPEGDMPSPENKKTGILNVLRGDLLVNEKFIKLFPFLMYVVFLLMLCIANTYIAEDVNREIARLNREKENLYVEYVYYKSELTKSTTQSNLARKLQKKGIKESIVPLRKIVQENEGGKR